MNNLQNRIKAIEKQQPKQPGAAVVIYPAGQIDRTQIPLVQTVILIPENGRDNNKRTITK
jgi:hypothetical protein